MPHAFRAAVVAALLALGAMMLRAADVPIRFTEVAAVAGLVPPKVPVPSAKDFLIDTTGNGVAFLDYDADGDLDVLIVNGSTFDRLQAGGDRMVTLFRNDGGRFTDVTTVSGLTRRGWGTGVCVADYDNDGFADVYVTAFTGNVLWHNVGGRRFEATAQAADAQWSTGCAFGDYDRDGYVDLYVANYVRMEPGKIPSRTTGTCRFLNIDVACGPRPLPGEPDRLYHNTGKGTFVDVTKRAGIIDPGYYGFSVLFSDLDDDGWPDIYVANDSTPNLFFRNQRNGTFVEQALQSGLAVTADGREQAGMGVDAGDYDGDGRLDLVKTNFSQDYTSLYHNDGGGLFTDVSFRSGLAATLGRYLGWGVGFVDLDNDGLLDLFIANGHIYPDVERTGTSTFRQRNQVFRNMGGGRFRHATDEIGGPLLVEKSSRGTAFGDFDNDGDIDVLVSVLDEGPMLLRNDTKGGHWITLRLEGTVSNRSAIGAKVTVEAAGRRQVAEVRSGGSYVSQNDMRVHVGLGPATDVDRVSIRWPNGNVETATALAADRFYVAREGSGLRPGK
jgi:enediyne biosynthesis protein E4